MKPLAVSLALMFSLACALRLGAVPTLPNINTNNIITVTNSPYNAVGDGVFTNTAAIQNAINAATAGGNVGGLFGGTVRIPPGIFLCGPLAMKKNVNLQLDAGAILRLLPYDKYPGGITSPADFITASSLTNLAVTGLGAIDGQGSPWWPGYKTNSRPVIISFSACSRVLLQDFTCSNPPMQHVSIKGNNAGDVTFQGISLIAPSSSDPLNPSHNTDGVDFAETNGLFVGCLIDTGDDNIAFGSSAGLSRDLVVTNCIFLAGHGVSIGSYTSSGVSNLTVVNCSFNGTDNGIRIKSQRDRGGLVQNLNYTGLTMTNVGWPFLIYSYYEFGLGTLTPANSAYAANVASTDTVTQVTSTTPIYRNITFSSITAYANNSRPALMIWGLPQMCVSNVIFKNVTLSAAKSVEIFNARGIQFIDSSLNYPAGTNGFDLFNAGVIITNSTPTNTLCLFDGISTNGWGNFLWLYKALGSLKNTNAFDDGPLTLSASTFTVSNNLTLFPTTTLNYELGTNAATLAVKGNLALGGTNNLSAGTSFTNGSYTLMSYTGTLSGSPPVLGTTPAGYAYAFDTNTVGLVKLVVAIPPPPAPTNCVALATNLLINLKWNSVSGATNYNLKRGTVSGIYPSVFSGLTATNYANANVTNAVNYFYVVTAVGAGGESTNSLQVSAAPLPSNQPTNIVFQTGSGQLQLAWPPDHLGWRLQIQTNSLSAGLSPNWATVGNSTNVNSMNIPIDPNNNAVFLRLVYP